MERIGKGGFGTVHKGCRDVAIKILDLDDQDKLHLVEREFSIHKKLIHPNIVEYYGQFVSENFTHLNIVMEYCDCGSLYDFLYKQNSKKFSVKQKLSIVIDILKGTIYLHSLGIIHRDLKPMNILIKSFCNQKEFGYLAKIADFGLSRILNSSDSRSLLTPVYGTFQYTAPEIFRGDPNDHKSDIYSIAILIWELFSEIIPYSDTNLSKEQIIIPVAMKGLRPNLDLLSNDTPHDVKSILKSMWIDDPNLRTDLETNLQKFIQIYNFYDVI